MKLGPCSVLAIQSQDFKMRGEILAALIELVQKGILRVADVVVVRKDADGKVVASEIKDLADDEMRMFDPLNATVTGLLSNDDIKDIGEILNNGAAAGLLVVEHLWANKLAEAIENANGKIVLNRLLMPELLQENLDLIEAIKD